MSKESRLNHSNNPVLSRYEKPAAEGQPGFAYQEGQTALAQASGEIATPDQQFEQVIAGGGARITIADVIVKSTFIFAIVVVFAIVGWNTYEANPWMLFVSLFVGLGLGFANAFKKKVSPVLVILYAVFEGYLLGAISFAYNDYAESIEYYGLIQPLRHWDCEGHRQVHAGDDDCVDQLRTYWFGVTLRCNFRCRRWLGLLRCWHPGPDSLPGWRCTRSVDLDA